MVTLKVINDLYDHAIKLEANSRKSSRNIDFAKSAADEFDRVHNLTIELCSETSDSLKKTERLALATYYKSLHHKNLAWFHYMKRDADQAISNESERQGQLSEAIQLGISVLDQIDTKGKELLTNNLKCWNFEKIASTAAMEGVKARACWDKSELIEALDHYRNASEAFGQAFEYIKSEHLESNYYRITLGNLLTMQVNEQTVLTQISLRRTAEYGIESIISVLRSIYQAYLLSIDAQRANPEWDELPEMVNHNREGIIKFLETNKSIWPQIHAAFSGIPQFHSLMKECDPARFQEVAFESSGDLSPAERLWLTGSFWILLFVVVAAFLLYSTSAFGIVSTISLVAAAIVLTIVIGALILRSTGELSEASLIDLVRLALRLQAKQITKIFKKSA